MSLEPCWFHGVGGRTGRLGAIGHHHIPMFPSPQQVPPLRPIPPSLSTHMTDLGTNETYQL